jgi:signal transduction histidine kinase
MQTNQPKRGTPEPGRRSTPFLWGVRSRILIWYVVLMAAATVASVLVLSRVLTVEVDSRIDAALVQETEELRDLARGRDPETGERFRGDVARIFEVFMDRNIPVRNEAYVTFIGGQPFLRSSPYVTPYRLDRDPELVARWGGLTHPERGRVLESPAGTIDYLAVPLEGGGQVRGVFVAAFFRDLELDQIDPAVWGAIAVGVVTLLVGSLLAWRVAEGVLRPVRLVTGTALSISEGDLTRRIEVTGRDEVAALATTFNEMLDRLEEAFATQRRFVDDAGHELRTPITIIRGHLELLEDDPQERGRTLALVMDELERMQRIVNDLLILAKAEQPDFLDLDTVDVEALTTEIHAKAAALASRDWRLERTGRGIVVADRQRLTQAMMQLAQNAAQHTEDGGTIGIGSAVVDGETRLWVRDNGPGIPADQRERVFRRFSRGGGGRRSEGAGIGLAIVKAIAEAHHGRIELGSRPGSGSTFSIVIPTDQPEDARG